MDTITKPLEQLNGHVEHASSLMHRGMESVRHTSQQLRDDARRAGDNTVTYIKQEPVKSVLLAAATGAALMALVNLASSWRHRR